MLLSLAAIALGSHLVVTVADRVPNFDPAPSCRAARTGASVAACVTSERGARDQLVKEWTQFSIADKTSCTQETEGFEPSYVELLTCLEAARDSRQVPVE
jgi:hypothetical protein